VKLWTCPNCKVPSAYRDDLRGEYHCDNGCGFHASEPPSGDPITI
jgi:hypothetical protein